MAEYIEREAALAAINALRGPRAMPKICIEKIPAADVAPVRHGRWVCEDSNAYVDNYRCNQCGEYIHLCNEIYTQEKQNYCPNCGAKMDEEEA